MSNNIKEILEEIIENNPELKKSEKELSEIIKLLKSSQPDIKISGQFKKDLKNRLKYMTELKENKPKGYLYFLIPSFTLALSAFGFFYFLGDTLFIVDDNTQNKVIQDRIEIIKVSEDDFIKEENIEENNIKLPQLDDKIEPKNRLIDLPITESISTKNTESIDSIESTNSQIVDDTNNDLLIEKSDISNSDEANTTIEDTQITDILGDLDTIFDESFNADSMGVSEANLDSMIMEEEELTFKDFCNNEGGIITEINGKKICTVENKYCNELDYINSKCKFIELK